MRSRYITGVGVELELSEADWQRITDGMYMAMHECGSAPSNRHMRLAFAMACQRIGVALKHEQPVAAAMDGGGK